MKEKTLAERAAKTFDEAAIDKDVEKIKLARRFSPEDWGWLCTKERFTAAVENGEIDQAEVIAWILLHERNAP